jgi:hypothetical protein
MALELFYKKFIDYAAASYKRALAVELNKIGTSFGFCFTPAKGRRNSTTGYMVSIYNILFLVQNNFHDVYSILPLLRVLFRYSYQTNRYTIFFS